MPKVSVITPTYNRPDLLRGMIKSVLDQTFKDFELVIIDDCPEYPSIKVIQEFTDSRIKYLQNEKRIGAAASRTRAILNSTGEYISALDDDDRWDSRMLELEVAALDRTQSKVGFCFSGSKGVFDDGQITIKQVPEGIGDYLDEIMGSPGTIVGITVMIRRSVYEDVGYWDPEFPSHQEFDLLIRIAKKYKGIGINQPLAFIGLGGHEHIGSDFGRRITGREMVLKKHWLEFEKRPKILAFHEFFLGLMYRDTGKYKIAQEHFILAFKHDNRFRYLLHWLVLIGNGRIYKIFRKPQSRYKSKP